MIYYPKNRDKQLDDKLFQKPTAEYRGIPFWAWNCKITEELIDRQLDYFQEMGFGGVDIHPRIGLDTEYLGEEYFRMIRYTVDKCKEKGLLCWLYDEDRYPSGVAGGFVTQDRHFAARGLLLTESYGTGAGSAEACLPEENAVKMAEGSWILPGYAKNIAEFEDLMDAGKDVKGYYVTAYGLDMTCGCLKDYRRLQSAQDIKAAFESGQKVRFAYVKLAECEARFQGNPYVDTLNPEAAKRFLEVTHEEYFKAVGEDFGGAVPAMFTDEPRISSAGKPELLFADSSQDVVIPYTDYFAEQMQKRFGVDPLDIVPDFVWNRVDGSQNRNRYIYREVAAECFVGSYMDEISKWCADHGIAMTGHVLSEESLLGQTRIVGDCMRCYREMELPGIDVLIDNREYSTVKQVASVVRQNGREGAISELYGVTHWDCSFKTYKLQGDWQAALGITVRIPHLSWMSMEGEAKRDWPASISYQSPWYGQWPYLEDYFARVNTALTRGKAVSHIGVIHPVETMWLHQGPIDHTLEAQNELDKNFADLNQWLLFATLDFDYISEALLPGKYEIIEEKGRVKLRVGEMAYTTILVPFLKTIRSTTLKSLEEFRSRGGQVVFMGEIPGLVDAYVSDRALKLAESCTCIPCTKMDLLNALEPVRELEIRKADGSRSDNLIYQMREDGSSRWLFVCHVNPKKQRVSGIEQYRCKVRGNCKVTLYDTMTGEKKALLAWCQEGWTTFFWNAYAEDSILVKLDGCEAAQEMLQKKCEAKVNASGIGSDGEVRSECLQTNLPEWPEIPEYQVLQKLTEVKSFECAEPNMLLLDYAKYRLDDGPIHEKEEILQIDDQVREELGYMLRKEDIYQPWAMPEREPHKLTLHYEVESLIDCPVKLAIERPEMCSIFLNGTEAEHKYEGYYVDEAIIVMPLPDIRKGINELVIEMEFNQRSNPENVYLLGEFGVEIHYDRAVITERSNKLTLGDITGQGMPFYTGNLEYHFKLDIKEEKEYFVHLPHFKAPVLGVSVDGDGKGLVAYAPHRLSLGVLAEGEHDLSILLYGNRYNGFGTLHNANEDFTWWGPGSYRTTGDDWTDSYMLRSVGILDAIEIECKK